MFEMKEKSKYLRIILTVLIALTLCTSAVAAETPQESIAAYTIIVNDQTLDLSDLPLAPYKEGDTVMVPLRKIGEALGYKVDWDSETGAISIDDEYIQKATLFNGTATVIFEGRLQVINLSRETENSVKTVIHSGYTYVPMEFFEEFFNDVAAEDMTIKIAPSKSEIDTIMPI